jgi:hypothetical protein
MRTPTGPDHSAEGRQEDALAETRQGIVERLADPYLTEHDRWVLRQFARFLEGITPCPGAPSVVTQAAPPLPQPGRWARVSGTLEGRPCRDGRH